MAWKRMTRAPKKSGRYIVKHRGQSGGDAYFNAGELTSVPIGWSQLPAHGVTHWLDESKMRPIPFKDTAKRFWPKESKRKVKCSHCNGKGVMWWQFMKPCSKCGGAKWVYIAS